MCRDAGASHHDLARDPGRDAVGHSSCVRSLRRTVALGFRDALLVSRIRAWKGTFQLWKCDRPSARTPFHNFFRQITVRSDEQDFSYDALVFFERAFDPVHTIAISIRHCSNNLVVAGSRRSRNHVRNAGHHFADAELTHR